MCAASTRESLTGMTEAAEPTPDDSTQHDVFVRSPRRGGLGRVLTEMGATVRADADGGLSVTGMQAWRIAAAAAANLIPIQELTPRTAAPSQKT
jgi:hypothetical protein